ncbi:hypothetical protein [Spirosoma areae]
MFQSGVVFEVHHHRADPHLYAHYYNGVLFAAYQNAAEGFKPQHWMQAAGFDANKVPCFAATDPRLGTTTTPTNNPNPTGGCGNGSVSLPRSVSQF